MPIGSTEIARVLADVHSGTAPAAIETAELDFKRQPASKTDAIRTLVDAAICFANGEGGTLVMGLTDRPGGTEAFLGCDLDAGTAQQRIHELTEPPLMVAARAEEHYGVRILIVDVLRSFEVHADKQGRATRRLGTNCVPVLPQEHQRMREERLGVDWSAQPSGRTPADIVPQALLATREALSRLADERAGLASVSDQDLLRALGVVDADDRLLRAGEVMLCSPPTPTIVYQHRATPGGEATAVERIAQPLILAFEQLMELVWARRNVTPLTLPTGQQIEISDFPEAAVREALSNALLHRDFRLSQPVQVEHSPSAFVVMSPGPLVGSVTEQNILTHASTPRNPILARAARTLGLAEETGRGVDRMFREMIRVGHDLPLIVGGIDFVRVVLSGGAPRASIVRYVAQLPREEREDTDTMLVLFELCRERTVAADSVAPILQKAVPETEMILRRLAQDQPGMLEPTRASRRLHAPQYRLRADTLKALGTAVRYQRRTVDETDRKVLAHLREYGTITNRTLQNLFDIDVWRARDILADLQQRELIVRVSQARRGPRVVYGPGARFPKTRRRASRATSRASREPADPDTLF
ncbi:MAG TPA: ATP-binding protein [Conexibacter sp.]|nr:ATP-binding protein [Conexibacter sp.]